MKSTGYKSTYKKLVVQWLTEALCFVSSSVVAVSFRLRNRQLLVAANLILVDLIKKRGFVKLLDSQLFKSELIYLSVNPETELFNGLMKRQFEFTINIEDILIKKLNY